MTMFILIETKLFTRLPDEHLSDDDLSKRQAYLNEHAETGDITAGQVVCVSWLGIGGAR